MKLIVELGELRGRYVAIAMRKAFKQRFNREPDYNMNFNEKSGFPEDFIEARKLIDQSALLEQFHCELEIAGSSLLDPIESRLEPRIVEKKENE
jgi:hypothetical protein